MKKEQKSALRSCKAKLEKAGKTLEEVRTAVEDIAIEIHSNAYGIGKADPEEEITPLHRAGETLLHMLEEELKEVKSYITESMEAG